MSWRLSVSNLTESELRQKVWVYPECSVCVRLIPTKFTIAKQQPAHVLLTRNTFNSSTQTFDTLEVKKIGLWFQPWPSRRSRLNNVNTAGFDGVMRRLMTF